MSDELEREERRIADLFAEVQAPPSTRRWESGAAEARRRGAGARFVAALIGGAGERRLRPLAAALVVPLLVLAVGGGLGLHAHFTGTSGSAGDPPARSGAAMAFDADHGVVVMFGGRQGRQVLGDTWAWDGSGWFEQHPAHSPSARANASMAYDAAHHQLLLFGGDALQPMGNQVTAEDTWTWDGSDWHVVATAHTPHLLLHGMGFDPATGQLLLVGYAGPSGAPGASAGGLNVFHAQPPPHSLPQVTGGAVPQSKPLPTPIFEGGTASTRPAPGGHGVIGQVTGPINMVPNPSHEALQTWVWTGSDWAQRSPRTSPFGSFGPVAPAWDGAAGGLILVTEQIPVMATTCAATVPPPPATAPQPMQLRPCAAAPLQKATPDCAVGCVASHEWRWDGGNWTELQPGGGFAPSAPVADPATGSAIGITTGSTFRDDGRQWLRSANPAGLLNRSSVALAADTERKQVVLFGGRSPRGEDADTWTWDGHTWTHRAGPLPDSRPLPMPSLSARPLPGDCPIEGLPQMDVSRPAGSKGTLVTLHFLSPSACGHLDIEVVAPGGQRQPVLHNPLTVPAAQPRVDVLWLNWCGTQAVNVQVSNPYTGTTGVRLAAGDLPPCTDPSQPSTLSIAHPVAG